MGTASHFLEAASSTLNYEDGRSDGLPSVASSKMFAVNSIVLQNMDMAKADKDLLETS